ncbi:putative fes/CIP4, and EFC/F-BAR homology domain containing protein [Lyophyllum shimeji]|uniref:Fes/CIP4, and EFC/F-BAR homology domain containing protein n=1 Tax=Lyophyllum shimeji TaxID=47721 RepID=A0A9P3PYQ4_LYOSH|nr:putative fes/CIP4, and EFC/F-BAR homology domain containing protein [Lyophyllum shimeji]
MQSSGQSYGQKLPDQVERIAALFDAHLETISDVRELFRDRAALEREYAAKLQLLTKKALEKKTRLEASLVLGEHPTKAWDASSLMQNSLNAAYTELIDSLVTTAQDHVSIADNLTSQVVDVLKGVEKKNEEAKKKEMQFFQKLLSDRDRVYADRLKSKQKYDEDCNEVESYRQKQSRAHDDKHADRAAKQAEQQRSDMLNSKNVYLISIAVANNAKAQFYNASLPELEDQFQLLQRRLAERFTKILQHSQALQLGHLDSLKNRVNRVEAALERVDAAKDQDLFIDHNLRPFTAPNDWVFEPCSGHYDTSEMSVEPTAKIFLQNKLSRSRAKLEELVPLINTKRREQDLLSAQVAAYKADHTLSNIDEVSDNLLEAQHQLTLYTTSEKILQAEIETIVVAIGDDEGARQPHSFKSSSFSIPTHCEYCKTSIWGLGKQGKTCKLCGISVHSKCELKVPADCQNAGSVRPQSSLIRKGTSASSTSSRVSVGKPPSASSFVQSTAEESSEESYPIARVLFDFAPTSEFELGVSEDDIVHVMEPDDGSGWVKVVDKRGRNGLVPASYLEHDVAVSQAAATLGGSGQYVRAIYPYEAQGQDELGLIEGQTIELTSGPSGGQHYGDGWWEGFDSTGRKGIFPSNYVEMV